VTDLETFQEWIHQRWERAEAARDALPEHRREKGKGACFSLEIDWMYNTDVLIQEFIETKPHVANRGIGVVDPDDEPRPDGPRWVRGTIAAMVSKVPKV
jgi:hypothetical protein